MNLPLVEELGFEIVFIAYAFFEDFEPCWLEIQLLAGRCPANELAAPSRPLPYFSIPELTNFLSRLSIVRTRGVL
jgi:hypothetical protein